MDNKKRAIKHQIKILNSKFGSLFNLKETPPLSFYIKPALIGLGFGVIIFFVASFSFLNLFHSSLNHIYAGSIPIRADTSDQQLEQKIKQASENFKITIVYPDKSQKNFKLSDTGVSIDTSKSISNIKHGIRNSLIKRLRWWKPLKLNLISNINNETLGKFIDTNASQITTQPKNATLSIINGNAVISPEVEGSGNIIENAKEIISQFSSNLESTSLPLEPSKLEPVIKTQNLIEDETKVKQILSQKIVFDIAGKQITPSAVDIANWIEITPIESDKTVDITINSGKIVQYIDKIARPYIQPPRSKLISSSPSGTVVLDYGRSGTDVINKDQAASDMSQKVLDAKGANVVLTVKYSAAKTVNVESYDKYIVIDVTTKRMYAYEKTNLIRTFLISAGAPKTPTVLGQYSIYSKVAKQDMRGLNTDGSRYFQPDVQYVNYFYRDYAIHGNYWRPLSYFGNVNSSHGCVGIVNVDAAWLYSWAPIGTPVIVHS